MSLVAAVAPRTADPYTDLAVIDSRAPRFNQAAVALLSITALLTGAWPLFAVLAVQLTVGLVFGRQYCLPCAAYFKWVQPRWGEGPLEDARLPRFANILAVIFLWGTTLLFLAGFPGAGRAVGGMVAVLATLASTTGLCVGCEVYRLIARLKGIAAKAVETIDLQQLGAAPAGDFVLSFTHPLCSECHEVDARLKAEGKTVVKVDVSKRGDLARKYGVSLVPLAFSVKADGTVLSRVA